MLKWEWIVEGMLRHMYDENENSGPSQGAYYFVFALSMIFLAVSMFQYPLW